MLASHSKRFHYCFECCSGSAGFKYSDLFRFDFESTKRPTSCSRLHLQRSTGSALIAGFAAAGRTSLVLVAAAGSATTGLGGVIAVGEERQTVGQDC